jgi:hypothetical protein
MIFDSFPIIGEINEMQQTISRDSNSPWEIVSVLWGWLQMLDMATS